MSKDINGFTDATDSVKGKKDRGQLITPELRKMIRENDFRAYDMLKNIVMGQLKFKKSKGIIQFFPMEDICDTVTGKIYKKIYDGEWDDNKVINLSIVCNSALYNFIAEVMGIKKDKMHRIKRIEQLSDDYNIPVNMTNIYKFVRLSETDGYSVSLGYTEVWDCIEHIHRFHQKSQYMDNVKYET